ERLLKLPELVLQPGREDEALRLQGVRPDEWVPAELGLDEAVPDVGIDDRRKHVERVAPARRALEVGVLDERDLRLRCTQHRPLLRNPGEVDDRGRDRSRATV